MPAAAAALSAYASADAAQLAGGSIELLTGAGAVLATIAFNSGSAGTVAGAVFTAAGMPKIVTAAASGTVAGARMRTSAAADYQTGLTVGIAGSGANVIIDNGVGTLVVAAGDAVTVLSCTLTHANGT